VSNDEITSKEITAEEFKEIRRKRDESRDERERLAPDVAKKQIAEYEARKAEERNDG
jgi:predicted  nucleic acid-binding Zn-ribbon protein